MWDDPRETCERLLDEGKPEEAERAARAALQVAHNLYGDGSDPVARCSATLGQVLLSRAHPREAIAPLVQAFRILEREPLSSERAAETLDLLGEAYEQLGKPRRAERAFVKGLSLRERAFGPEDADIAKSLEHLAHLRVVEHDNAAAEQLLLRAQEILEHAPSRVDEMCDALHRLGAVYLREGKLLDARRTFKRALRLKFAKLGPNDPGLAEVLRDLGIAWARSGELGFAEILLRRALELKKKGVTSDHPSLTLLEHQLRDVVRSKLGQTNEIQP